MFVVAIRGSWIMHAIRNHTNKRIIRHVDRIDQTINLLSSSDSSIDFHINHDIRFFRTYKLDMI